MSIRISYCAAACVFCLLAAARVAADSPPAAGVRIRSGNIILKVPDFQAARAKVMKLAGKHGAELREAQTEVNFSGGKHGEMMLQVNASRLDPLMDDIRRIGKLYSERVQTSDQTSHYDKLGQRSELLRRNEAELLQFVRSPRQMRGSDLLFVQYRLYQTRVEIANASQEQVDLSRGARRSLLHVMLFEPEPRQSFDWRSWNAHAMYRANGAFQDKARKTLAGLYHVLWLAPFWVPPAAVLTIGGRWARRRYVRWRIRRQQESATGADPPPGIAE